MEWTLSIVVGFGLVNWCMLHSDFSELIKHFFKKKKEKNIVVDLGNKHVIWIYFVTYMRLLSGFNFFIYLCHYNFCETQ